MNTVGATLDNSDQSHIFLSEGFFRAMHVQQPQQNVQQPCQILCQPPQQAINFENGQLAWNVNMSSLVDRQTIQTIATRPPPRPAVPVTEECNPPAAPPPPPPPQNKRARTAVNGHQPVTIEKDKYFKCRKCNYNSNSLRCVSRHVSGLHGMTTRSAIAEEYPPKPGGKFHCNFNCESAFACNRITGIIKHLINVHNKPFDDINANYGSYVIDNRLHASNIPTKTRQMFARAH